MDTFSIEDIARAKNLGVFVDSIRVSQQNINDTQVQIDQLKLSEDEQIELLALRDKLRAIGLN